MAKQNKLTFPWLMLYIMVAFVLVTYVVLATWYIQGAGCVA
ncbi:MAG: hypothetical protein WCS88_03505 [Patescibacteria group bacterium]|jgi:hypothetical protein